MFGAGLVERQYLNVDLREKRKLVIRVFEEGCSGDKEQPVQRPLGKSISGMFKEKQEGGVARVKGAMQEQCRGSGAGDKTGDRL